MNLKDLIDMQESNGAKEISDPTNAGNFHKLTENKTKKDAEIGTKNHSALRDIGKIGDALKGSNIFDTYRKSAMSAPSALDFKMPYIPTSEERNNYRSAEVFMRTLATEALRWKNELPENQTPKIVALLYGGIEIDVHILEQVSFDGIKITGMMRDAQCSLFAHQSTVQILCLAREVTIEKPKNPIGFIWNDASLEV